MGGQVAAPGEFPWMVAVVDAGTANPLNGQFCGASLIDAEWVLTAAHCLVNNGTVTQPADIEILVGVNNLSSGPSNGTTGQRVAVSQVIPHPSYNEATEDSDIALLKLASAVSLDATVAPIGLVGSGDSALVTPGTTATVSGWGHTSFGGTGSDALLKVDVPIVSNATCNSSSSYNGQITVNMMCAGFAQGGKDSCQGDSGGPLVVSDGVGGWKQAGVVSFGQGCAEPNFYGVYTRLSQFKSWVDSLVGGVVVDPDGTVYLPLVNKGDSGSGGCTTLGESDNIGDALAVNSGQAVCGQVSLSDLSDVYRISAAAGQQLNISMTGAGGDADLYLFPPGSTDIFFDTPSATSENPGSTESIQYTATSSGSWYIAVYAYDGTIDYNLTVSVSSP